ncbi:MAG: DNA methyltransferase [Opitutales bacterium]
MGEKIKIHCSHTELRDPTSLVEHPRNYNTHPAEQIRLLAKIIQHQGWRNPITVSKRSGFVVKGHGRLAAAMLLKTEKVPVDVQDYKDEASEVADMIADNRIAELAEADEDALKDLLVDEVFNDFDLELTGFDPKEIDFIINESEVTDDSDHADELESEADELKNHWGTDHGQIWKLGDHRLMCGDSTNDDHVSMLMQEGKADVCFTSPPYNAATKSGQGDIFNKKKSVKLYQEEYTDNLDYESYVSFASKSLDLSFSVTDGFVFWNVSYNGNCRSAFLEQIKSKLKFLVETICWKKSSTIPFKGSLMRDWEPVFLFSTNGETLKMEKVTSNHWEISNTNSQHKYHKACFPLELVKKGIDLIKPKTNIVYEPFCGSGTTLIACDQLNRKCYAMEISPQYVAVAIQRWHDLTGKKPELISDVNENSKN